MKVRPFLLLLSAIGLPLALSGCNASMGRTSSLPAAPETLRSLQRYERAYLLAPGDTVEVMVDRMPEISRTVTIRPDGMVALPKVGEVRFAGITPAEATQLVHDALSRRIINPEVTTIVTNPREDKVFVAGEVGRPGALSLREVRTAAEALVLSGDVTRAGTLSNVALIRLDPSGYLTATIVQSQAAGRAGLLLTLQNIVLQPGDILVVQESKRSQFARFVQDYINTPLTGFNQLLGPYIQFRLLQEINR
jgi:polysaccharide export outer membrane protein